MLVESDDQLIIECLLDKPPTSYSEYTTAIYDPVLADITGQPMSVWVRHHLGVSCLPAAVTRIDAYRALDFGAPFIVIAENFRQPGPNTVLADITVCDTTGEVLRVIDTIRQIGNAALNEVFAASATAPSTARNHQATTPQTGRPDAK